VNYSEEIVKSAHSHATNNFAELEASTTAACFYCLEVYPASKIERWLKEGKGTACCPECTIDAVIGDASSLPIADRKFRDAMHDYWFNRTVAFEDSKSSPSDGSPTLLQRLLSKTP